MAETINVNRKRLRKRGVSLTSYGLIVGLISIVALAAVTGIGSNVDSLFTTVGDELGGVVAADAGPTAQPSVTPGGCTPDTADLNFDEASSGSFTLTVDSDEIDCTFQFRVDGASGGCGEQSGVCVGPGDGGRNEFTFVPGEVGDFEIIVGGGGGQAVEESTGAGGGGASSVGFTPTASGTYFTLSIAGGGGGSADGNDFGGDGHGNGTGGDGSGGDANIAGGGNGVGGAGAGDGEAGANCALPCQGGRGGEGRNINGNGGFGVGTGRGGDVQGSGGQDGGGGGGGYGGGGAGAVNDPGGGGGGIVVTGNGAVLISGTLGGANNAPTNGGTMSDGADGRVQIISISP